MALNTAIVNQSTVATAFMAPAVGHVQCPLASGRDTKEEAIYGSAEGKSSSEREGSRRRAYSYSTERP